MGEAAVDRRSRAGSLGRLTARSVRDAAFDVFRRRGLTTLFSNPGSTEVPFLAGLPDDLRFVPKGKVVVLGLVTTKRGELESRDELRRRIEEASQYVDVDQLCLSPQCGFSSTVEGNDLTAEQQAAKLRLVVEVAEEVWS